MNAPVTQNNADSCLFLDDSHAARIEHKNRCEQTNVHQRWTSAVGETPPRGWLYATDRPMFDPKWCFLEEGRREDQNMIYDSSLDKCDHDSDDFFILGGARLYLWLQSYEIHFRFLF